MNPLFEPLNLKNVTLRNRILRAATYEGLGGKDGCPLTDLGEMYSSLAAGGCGAIITGFAYISREGRAMQPGQCGMDSDDKIAPWSAIVSRTKAAAPDIKLFLQLAHSGRQTRSEATGLTARGVSARKCTYFRQKVSVLPEDDILRIIGEFAAASARAKAAGFDGVQLHAAHGYLIHQFLSPWTNARSDRWGKRTLFLAETLSAVKTSCGADFPVFVKLSAAEDNSPGLTIKDAAEALKVLESGGADAAEISYGTMEYALNIIRGAVPLETALRVNPLFSRLPGPALWLWKKFMLKPYLSRLIPFEENYNLEAASRLAAGTALPVFVTGGLRRLQAMTSCVTERGLAGVSLCRPLIREPDLPLRLRNGSAESSACTQCNLCAIYCDSSEPLRCRGKGD